jgi:hypothetical protein
MLNPIVNMIVVLEKELELEKQGLRRTRRWIGDASRVTDAGWYRRKVSPVAESRNSLDEGSKVAEVKHRRDTNRSILTRRQPACEEC